eukprot:6518291-Alexandrium_andersonii.AAC.1
MDKCLNIRLGFARAATRFESLQATLQPLAKRPNTSAWPPPCQVLCHDLVLLLARFLARSLGRSAVGLASRLACFP